MGLGQQILIVALAAGITTVVGVVWRGMTR